MTERYITGDDAEAEEEEEMTAYWEEVMTTIENGDIQQFTGLCSERQEVLQWRFYRNEGTLFHAVAREGSAKLLEVAMKLVAQPHRKDSDAVVAVRLNQRDSRQQSPVHLVAARGCTASMNCLRHLRVDVTATDRDGLTPLHHACNAGHVSTIQWLCDAASSKDYLRVRTAKGLSALECAVRSCPDHLLADVVEALLRHGAEIDMRDHEGCTALHFAAGCGESYRVVDVLRRFGAKVNAKAKDGTTPLHCAAFAGNDVAIRALIDAGADPNIESKEGKTAFHNASRSMMNRYRTFVELVHAAAFRDLSLFPDIP